MLIREDHWDVKTKQKQKKKKQGDGDVISVHYQNWDLRGCSFLWWRLWGPGVNPWLCQGACLRRLLSHHTFVALWAGEKGHALRTSLPDATLTAFRHHHSITRQRDIHKHLIHFYLPPKMDYYESLAQN